MNSSVTADRHVEVVPAALRMLGLDEFEQVGMVAVEHGHLRAAPRAGAFDGAARRVEHVHIAARPRRRRTGGVHARALGPDRGEVVADAAAAAHGFGRLQQRHVDAGQALFVDALDRVADRLHEAVDQRGRDAGAGRAHDAAGAERAVPQVVDEARFDRFAQRWRLRLGDAARDALEHVVGRLLVAFRVFLEQDVEGELLRRDEWSGRSGRRCCRAGFRRVFCHGRPSNGAASGRGAVGGSAGHYTAARGAGGLT